MPPFFLCFLHESHRKTPVQYIQTQLRFRVKRDAKTLLFRSSPIAKAFPTHFPGIPKAILVARLDCPATNDVNYLRQESLTRSRVPRTRATRHHHQATRVEASESFVPARRPHYVFPG